MSARRLRAVSVLDVAEPAVWAELEAVVGAHLGEALSPLRRVVLPSFEKQGLATLGRLGVPVLVRGARRSREEEEASRAELAAVVDRLSWRAKPVLYAAQRHASQGVAIGLHAWDPLSDAGSVRELLGAGLMEEMPELEQRYRLHPDLPPPPPVVYAFSEAAMPETADLPSPRPGPIALLHDAAALAAAIDAETPRRTLSGSVARADSRKLGKRLASKAVTEHGIEADDRWSRAMRALDALGAVSTDPVTRETHLDLGLEALLAGSAEDAMDRLLHRLVDPDLHAAVPAVREALRQAGDGAVDTLIWLEHVRDQDRGVLFPPWRRDGQEFYPFHEGETPRPYDDDGFEAIEAPLLRRLLGTLERMGVVRLAPGIFAGTPDGRRWARAEAPPPPPVWVSSDLEIVVPPDAITPFERFQLERLGRCLSREVADRYRLERAGLERWLAIHELDEALALLRRRALALPPAVVETLTTWAAHVTRIVLVRGVLLEEVG